MAWPALRCGAGWVRAGRGGAVGRFPHHWLAPLAAPLGPAAARNGGFVNLVSLMGFPPYFFPAIPTLAFQKANILVCIGLYGIPWRVCCSFGLSAVNLDPLRRAACLPACLHACMPSYIPSCSCRLAARLPAVRKNYGNASQKLTYVSVYFEITRVTCDVPCTG